MLTILSCRCSARPAARPAIFANADCFESQRQPNRYVAFGFGFHFCLGAPIAVQLVLERMPNLRLAQPEVQWMNHSLVRGLASLVVVF